MKCCNYICRHRKETDLTVTQKCPTDMKLEPSQGSIKPLLEWFHGALGNQIYHYCSNPKHSARSVNLKIEIRLLTLLKIK